MHRTLLAASLLAASTVAQNWNIPDNYPNAGTCNAIPLGGTAGGSLANQKYQTIVTASELGGVPGLVTGLAFAPCGTGLHTFATIQVVLDQIPATALSTTFAANLTSNAVTVLDASQYTWPVVQNVWAEIGLQNFFYFNGTDSLVVEVTVTGSDFAGTAGTASFHATSARTRVYATGWTGTPPAVGTAGIAPVKMQLSMQMARASSLGAGCVGSNTLAPRMVFAGTPQLGGSFAFQLADALPLAPSFLVCGAGFGPPYPIDLGVVGMPGCLQYFTLWSVLGFLADGNGGVSLPVNVPNVPALAGTLFLSQWVCFDPAANPAGVTTSNFGRILVGN